MLDYTGIPHITVHTRRHMKMFHDSVKSKKTLGTYPAISKAPFA